jgi:hypothetical protein
LASVADEPLAVEGGDRPAAQALGSPYMIGDIGDTIVIEAARVTATGRRGVIEEVVQGQPPRYRVRWENGHTSILAPSAGSARIEQKKRPRAKAKA